MDEAKKKKAQAVFSKLQAEPRNKKCIQCNAFNPQWASVSNAVYICIKCAGTHRSMGVHLSFVRSISMDSWSDVQLKQMQLGGNKRIQDFWSNQGFPKNLNPKQLYDNEAMIAYRKNLLEKAKGNNSSAIPKIGYKPIIRKKKPTNIGSNSSKGSSFGGTGFGSGPRRAPSGNADPWSDFFSSVGDVASKVSSSVAKTATTAASTVSQTVQNQDVKSTWNSAYSWVAQTATSAASNVNKLATTYVADQEQDGLSGLRNNLKPSRRQMDSLSSTALKPNRKKMPSLSSGNYFANEAPARKKMPSVSSDAFFNDAPKAPPQRKKMPALSSNDYFSPNSSAKKKMPAVSSDTFFNDEKPAPRQKNTKKVSVVQDNIDEFDLNDFGFSDDDNDTDPKQGVEAKIEAAESEDLDTLDEDFDNWGWGDDDDKPKDKETEI